MSNKLSIAVLIPTMNRPRSLKRTLDTYFNALVIPDQVIVVDQSINEEDRSKNKDIVESYSDKTQMIYWFQDTPSLTKARNTALSLTDKEILVFSDDDVDVKRDTLSYINRIMENKSISMIAGLDEFMPTSKSKIGYFIGTKSLRNRKIGHVTGSMLGRFPEDIQGEKLTQWAMGFFFVVKKSLIDKWNIKWDEELTSYAYAEDLDFSFSYYKKSCKEGLKCITSENVIVRHLASKEYRIPSRKHIFMFIINRAYLNYKHNMGRRAEVLMNWCNFCFLISSKIKRENYDDYRDAIKKYKTVKNQLKQGILKEEFYNL